MILYNPNNGAIIKDLWYESVKYFVSAEQDAFKPGDLVEVEDEIGKFVLSLFGFIESVTEGKAASIIKNKESQLKCEQCDFVTEEEDNLKRHISAHKSKATIKSKLGIKVVVKKEKETKKTQFESDYDRQQEIEADNKKDGLDIGDGLQTEHLGE